MSEARLKHAGQVAVVTGGARRLGRHLCAMLARRGYAVVVLYRGSDAEAASLVEEIQAHGGTARARALDVAVEAQVRVVFEDISAREGHVDLLVNKDRKSTRLNPSHVSESRMPSSA